MGSPWRYGLGGAVLVLGLGLVAGLASAEDPSVEELRRDLESMKQQLQKLQDQIKKQETVIEKLSAEKKPAAAPAAAPAAPPTETAAEQEERIKRQVTENIMRKIQPSLVAANKTFPSQFNPAIGLIIDTVGSYSGEHGGNFELRSAEIGLSASVDPFVRGYAVISGSNQGGFDVEEAAIVTTSLPYNLTFKGGRFFADFGRLSKFHDHDLPFVNRPIVLDEYVGGESQSDGVEASYLVPISQYVNLTAGWYNKMGAENERVDNTIPRNLSEFTYLGRANTYYSFTDAHSVDLGVSYAGTPRVKEDLNNGRSLVDWDLTYRYIPLSQASYRGLTWGTEVLYNQETRPVGGFVGGSAAEVAEANLARGLGVTSLDGSTGSGQAIDTSTGQVFQRKGAVGLYSYLEPRVTRRFYPGFEFQWVESIDPGIGNTLAYSPYLTIWASEFQRLRLQYTRLEAPGDHDNEFFLQWTVILGSHVHGFRDR